MSKKNKVSREITVASQVIEQRIYLVRDQKVMLDDDLADLYGVPTKRLNEQVTRNLDRFPEDFMFQLTPEEALAGVTREAARAIGRGHLLGTLERGKEATFLIWDVEHPAEIVLQLGTSPLRERIIRGRACPLPT